MTIDVDGVGCPSCFVRYADEPERCEACGYRFGVVEDQYTIL